MTHPLRTSEDYELFIYTLAERFPSINRSTLTFIRRGTSLARVAGELHFDHDIRLVVRERLDYLRLPMVIDGYGYEVWQGKKKLCWYDSQPHPHEFALQATHPHHKHVPPDIKHNRVPAPEMSFNQPNIPALIQEIESIIVGFNAE
ncbi:MAG: toxin-antitoxin system TumE family protein [Thermodesulfobacteriota bacterium]